MKVHWLNAECTEAFVSRGWLRPQVARVTLKPGDAQYEAHWTFSETGRYVGGWVGWRLEIARHRELEWQNAGKEWVPLRAPLPEARLIRGA